MDEELKKKIEAILFSVGKKINVEEIMRMTKKRDKAKVVACLIELKQKYNSDEQNSLMILQDGDDWKLTIKDQFIDVAKEIGIETELTKTVMETLAVIAYKNPVLQCDVIKIRTNKAYDHLKELEELGYIQRERYGRTKKIKLTQKFFDYFDLPPESLKEKFKTVTDMEKAIEDKETRIKEIHELKKQKLDEQEKEAEEKAKINIFMQNQDNPNLTEVLETDKGGMQVIKEEKLGDLTVVDEVENQGDRWRGESLTQQEKSEAKTEEKLGKFDVIDEPEEKHDYDKQEINDFEFKKLPEQETSFSENTEQSRDIDETDIRETKAEESTDIGKEIGSIQAKKEQINKDIDDQIEDNETEEKDKREQDIEDTEELNPEKDQNMDEKADEDEKGAEEDMEADNYDDKKPDSKIVMSNVDDEDQEPSSEIKGKKNKLKEDKLFSMEGIPDKIMEKIDEKTSEIMGEKTGEKEKEDLENNNSE